MLSHTWLTTIRQSTTATASCSTVRSEYISHSKSHDQASQQLTATATVGLACAMAATVRSRAAIQPQSKQPTATQGPATVTTNHSRSSNSDHRMASSTATRPSSRRGLPQSHCLEPKDLKIIRKVWTISLFFLSVRQSLSFLSWSLVCTWVGLWVGLLPCLPCHAYRIVISNCFCVSAACLSVCVFFLVCCVCVCWVLACLYVCMSVCACLYVRFFVHCFVCVHVCCPYAWWL